MFVVVSSPQVEIGRPVDQVEQAEGTREEDARFLVQLLGVLQTEALHSLVRHERTLVILAAHRAIRLSKSRLKQLF